MDAFYRPTWVEISLDALRHNLRAFRDSLPAEMKIMAVVKADAYGHGAVQIARECMAEGASYLAVAFMDEALELRRAGIEAPILVLGYTPAEAVPLAVKYSITINVYSMDVLEALAKRGPEEPSVKIHIKVDSGMGRLGLNRTEDAIAFIERALSLPGVEVEGLFTHYACADEADKSYTREQYSKFERVAGHFREKGISFTYVHAGNTATAIDTPEISYNMVRLGIGMYGLYPSDEVDMERVKLRPVMSLKTRIVMLKSMEEGAGVSYGALYHASRGEEIATLAVGYADGFSRMLTGKAHALVRGKRVPVVGRICMDQCMISLQDVSGAQLGDEVVMFGEQDGLVLPAEELAEKLGTVNYEIVCMISHRVPRVYMEAGDVKDTVNPLQHQLG
ncbi:alanine racemase [Paenibacillus sp. YN15]|uniref:alanine racemase n=1 Tax=Paenibacillus sp. YN15 TaxID=1742774 RepID=UPI000DCC89C9|nr:alanine racemase [Paenibacillus sp. YN15]RAU94048.1 alanine racemase [Paenibacillus sp. YN15]